MAAPQTLNQRAEAAHRQLKKLRRHFQRGAWITTIVGFGLLLLVSGYYYYGYSEISALRDPELIVSLVGDMLDQRIPQVRKALEARIEKNASAWAEQASQQVLTAIPPLREHLEEAASQKADAVIAQLDVMSEKEFRRLLKENRSTVQQAIQQLQNDEELSDDVTATLQQALEKELQVNMKDQAEVLLAVVSDLNKNMKILHQGKDLSPQQKAQRRVLMIARRLQKENVGDIRLDKLSSPVAEEVAQQLEQARQQKEAAAKPKKDDKTQAAAKPKKDDKTQAAAAKPSPPKEEKKKLSDDAKAAKPEAKKS